MKKFAAAFAVIVVLASSSIASNPSALAAYEQGLAAFRQNQFPQAIRSLTWAIDASKAQRDVQSMAIAVEAFRIRAQSYELLYQYDKAIADYNEAVRRAPRSAGLKAGRGLCLAEMQQFEKALDDCNQALQLDPKSPYAYAMRADVYREKGDWDRALADASKAIALDPKLWRAYQVRGRAYEGKKRFADAVGEYDQVIRLNGTYIRGHLARADALYEAGDYARASASFREALRRFPQSDQPHSFLAWFLSTCPDASFRNGKEAVAEALKACQMVDWVDWSNIDTLAAAYAEVGDFDRAVEYMNRVLRMRRQDAGPEEERDIREHIASYKKHQPFRQVPGK